MSDIEPGDRVIWAHTPGWMCDRSAHIGTVLSIAPGPSKEVVFKEDVTGKRYFPTLYSLEPWTEEME